MGEYRRGILDQSQRCQKAVHGPVQRIRIQADQRRLHVLISFRLRLGCSRQSRLGVAHRLLRNVWLWNRTTIGLLLKQKTPFIRFWIGPPSQPAKPLADRLLRQPQLARNRTVAGSFCFQMQNRLVASTIFRILETSGRPSRSPHQGAYPSSMEALLVTAETPGRAAE